MPKEVKDTSVTKTPKTVAVGVVLPWFIVVVLVAGVVGLIAGWFIHANAVSDVVGTVATLKN